MSPTFPTPVTFHETFDGFVNYTSDYEPESGVVLREVSVLNQAKYEVYILCMAYRYAHEKLIMRVYKK